MSPGQLAGAARAAFNVLLFAGPPLLHAGFFPAPSWEQKWLLIFGLTVALLIACLRDGLTTIRVPHPDGLARVGAALALAGFIVSFVINFDHVSWVRVAERICFFTLFVYALNQRHDAKFVAHLECAAYLTIGVLVAGYLARYRACQRIDAWAMRCPAPFLENRNMFVQALELQWILLTLAVGRRPPRRKTPYAIASALVIGVCLASHSRSALLTVGGTAFAMTLARTWHRVRAPYVAAALALFGLGMLALIDARTDLFDSSSLLRLRLLAAGWRVSLAHVWGVGIGNYPWVEWRERVSPAEQFVRPLFYKSPHNEILRLIAEEGWLTALGTYLALGAWLRRSSGGGFLKRLTKTSFVVFFVCETLLQFPFENPVPTVAMAGLLALVAPEASDVAHAVGSWTRALILALVLYLNGVTCAELYYFGRGRLLTIRRDVDRVLCRITPDFWPLCLEVGRDLERTHGDRAALKASLARQPDNVWIFAELTGVETLPARDAYADEVKRVLSGD